MANAKPFFIFVLMLKHLHIICLLILLGVGLVSCKKDNVTTLPDSEALPEVFDIREITEYDTSNYYIDSNVYLLDAMGSGSYILYDIDGDNLSDLQHYFKYSYDVNTNTSGVSNTIGKLNSDTIISFSTINSSSASLKPHQVGDSINTSLFWSNETCCWYFDLFESASNSTNYIAIRKRIGDTYKYGWICYSRISWWSHKLGPLVMQR